MDITCEHCQSTLKIPDEKIPADRTATVKCPKCKEKISVGPLPPAEKLDFDAGGEGEDDQDEGGYDLDDLTDDEGLFDFVEEEEKTALICESDPKIVEHVKKILDFMEYHTYEVQNGRDAIKNLRYHNYDFICINETFDSRDPETNGVLLYLSRLHMTMRRKTFVCMLTKRFRTMDNMMALNKSVNTIINLKHIAHFENILRKTLSDFDIFYRAYHETTKTLGIG